MPMPPPISSQSARWRSDALSRRGNQASGTVTVRPSERTTLKVSFVHDTSTGSTSARSTKVLMPSPQEKFSIIGDDLPDLRQFVAAKAAHIGHVGIISAIQTPPIA